MQILSFIPKSMMLLVFDGKYLLNAAAAGFQSDELCVSPAFVDSFTGVSFFSGRSRRKPE